MKLFLSGMTLEDYCNGYKNCFSGWTVYYHLSPNRKWYFGITRQNPFYRWGKNGNQYKNNNYFYNAIKKYGWDNFKHGIVATGLTSYQAGEMERYLIKKYNSIIPNGYNGTEGGEINIPTDIIKDKISNSLRGKRVSEETRIKISESRKGMRFSKETCNKISESKKCSIPWNKGKKGVYTKETRKKMSESKKGSIPWNKGKGWNEEYKRKKYKKVLCIETNELFESIKQAQEKYKTKNISAVCKGKRKTAGGYHWKYVN